MASTVWPALASSGENLAATLASWRADGAALTGGALGGAVHRRDVEHGGLLAGRRPLEVADRAAPGGQAELGPERVDDGRRAQHLDIGVEASWLVMTQTPWGWLAPTSGEVAEKYTRAVAV